MEQIRQPLSADCIDFKTQHFKHANRPTESVPTIDHPVHNSYTFASIPYTPGAIYGGQLSYKPTHIHGTWEETRG